MKKFRGLLAVVLVMVLVVALVGCTGTSDTPDAAQDDGQDAAQDAAQDDGQDDGQDTAQDAAQDDGQDAEDSEDGDTATEPFNPDEETDTIPYDQLEAEFGPIPVDDLPADIQVGAIMKNLANEFWLMLEEGIETEAADYGATTDVQASRTETDVQDQLAIAENMLSKNYSALLFSPLTNDNLDTVVAEAQAEGIPVINVNCEYISDADAFVGGLQIEIGRKAAEYIGEKLGGEGKVAIIEGIPGSFTNTQRVAGFMEVLPEKYPNIEIVASVTANYEREEGMNVAADILTQNPDISAFYCCNDNMALGAIEALRSEGLIGKVLVLGVDGTSGAYDSIEKGELTGTVDQFPVTNGAAALEVALRLLAGQDLPRVISTPIEVVDMDNVSDFK